MMVRFRQLQGEQRVDELLAQTINVAVKLNPIKPHALSRAIVDSTVQEKAIAHSTDSRLLEVACTNVVQAAGEQGIALKQTFVKEDIQLKRKAVAGLPKLYAWHAPEADCISRGRIRTYPARNPCI